MQVQMSKAEFQRFQFDKATRARTHSNQQADSCLTCLLLNCVMRCENRHKLCSGYMGQDERHRPAELAKADAESRRMPWELE